MSIFHKISWINMKTVAGFRFRNERPLRVDIFQSQCFCAYVSFQSQYSSLLSDRYLILKLLRCVHLNMYMLFYIMLMIDFLIRMYPPKQFDGSYTHVPLSANLVFCEDVHVFWRIIDNYTPAQRSWRGGILDSPCPSVRPSVCPSVCLSVDNMVSGA